MTKNEIMNANFPDINKITIEMASAALRQRTRLRGSVRLATGRLMTTDEIDAKREMVSKYRHST